MVMAAANGEMKGTDQPARQADLPPTREDLADALTVATARVELLLAGWYGEMAGRQASALREVQRGLEEIEAFLHDPRTAD